MVMDWPNQMRPVLFSTCQPAWLIVAHLNCRQWPVDIESGRSRGWGVVGITWFVLWASFRICAANIHMAGLVDRRTGLIC